MVFIKKLLPLTILYAYEGIILGLITVSVPQELIDKGIEITKYKFQFVVLLPFLIRYLIAPLFDSISWDKFGRRRTQLIVLYICNGVLLYFSNLNIPEESGWFWKMFWIMSILACIDMVVNSWLVESMIKDERGYGALSQYVGILVGGFIGAYIFQMFNSLEFCNLYIYATPQEVPYITLQSKQKNIYEKVAFKDLAFISIGLAVASIFFVMNETYLNQNIIESYKSAINAFSNRNILIFFLFFCFFRIGQMPIDLAQIHMKRNNFTEGQIQFLEILSFPIACILPYYVAKMIRSRQLEIRLIIVFSIYEIFISGLFIITLFASEEGIPFPYRDVLLKISLIAAWLLNIVNILLAQSYIFKITKSSISATFTSLLTTGINFQFIFEGVIEYFLANYNYYIIWLIGIGIYAIFFFHLASRATKIDQLDSDEFTLEIDIKKEKLLIQTELTTLS